MRHRLWTTITVLCGLLAATQFSPAQDLTPEQEARILQRFPQADPKNPDPVLRESTRLSVGGLIGTQATYDGLQWKDFIPFEREWTAEEIKAKEPDILASYGVQSLDELDTTKEKAIRKERDMLAWMSADDPPLWMKNSMRGGPVAPGDKGHTNHHPAHVGRLKERAEEVGIETVAIAPGVGLAPKPEVSMIDFFFKHLGVQ